MECKDCQMALDALARTPPSPPADLVATKSDKVVSLQWQPSPSKDVRYTIVRKYQARPISPNDGTQVATVSGTLYEDASPAPGLPAYYAVYANREGILSNDATVAAEPVMLAPGGPYCSPAWISVIKRIG